MGTGSGKPVQNGTLCTLLLTEWAISYYRHPGDQIPGGRFTIGSPDSLLLYPLFGPCRLFSAARADQRQVIFCVERIPANRLFSRGAQSDVYAPVVGHDQHRQMTKHLAPFVRTQVGILVHQLFYLSLSQVLILAKRPRLNVVRRNAVFNQDTLRPVYAALRQALVVFLRAAVIRVATENQMSVRLVGQVLREVLGQNYQDIRLTLDQAAVGYLDGGASGRKVNTMQGKLDLQLRDLRGRSRRSFHGHACCR